jgi:Fe-S oxidoreductase
MDQLLKYEFERIFPGWRLLDIHEYLMEKGVRLEDVAGVKYLYHDPCHSPMKTYSPTGVATKLLNADVKLSDRCCGEAGTIIGFRNIAPANRAIVIRQSVWLPLPAQQSCWASFKRGAVHGS